MNNQKAGRFARPAFGADMEEEDAMVLKKTAVAGTLESSDVMVTVTPNPGRGVEIELESEVKAAFGAAIEAAKRGCRIQRRGWNGKNQYVELASCISYTNAAGDTVNADHDAIGKQAFAFVGTSGVQMGWLASQADMLADDWEIVS